MLRALSNIKRHSTVRILTLANIVADRSPPANRCALLRRAMAEAALPVLSVRDYRIHFAFYDSEKSATGTLELDLISVACG